MSIYNEIGYKDLLDTMIKSVPKYEEPFKPFKDKDYDLGHPVCIKSAVRIFGKEVISDAQGIYHLFYDGILVYIGMSKNLRKRLLYHIKDKDKIFDAALMFPMPGYSLEEIVRYETKLIKLFTPSQNTACIMKSYKK